MSHSPVRTRVGSGRTAVRRARVSAGERAGRFGDCRMCRGRVAAAACFGWEEWLTVGRAWIVVPAGGATRCVAGGGLPGRRGVKRVAPGGAAVRAGGPGRKAMRLEFRFSLLWRGLPAAQCPGNQVGGARRGASERRYQATSSDMLRLKLLVEPHSATSSHSSGLYGMQEVRGSNLLSSTIFRLLVRHKSVNQVTWYGIFRTRRA